MKKGFFITGTDTDVGKSYVATRLIRYLNRQGFNTLALKPIASGCQETNAGLRNNDACQLQEAASIKLPYQMINPIAFKPPIAPHLAAQQQEYRLSVQGLLKACQPTFAVFADYYIVEGAGGWLCPLNEKETLADFAIALNFPIILVVGMKLGCLNHALLTLSDLTERNANIVGWIANCVDPAMRSLEDNITTLQSILPVPLLSIVQYEQMDITFLTMENVL